ncbi:unnamed protein product [Schistocephalus solidus]|uniref:Endo/exonuclease/phosphatase domain-containing protein n=1 Tax=Schistocephalus solidus TaxID=70667 RepID=A0A183TD09_SCHSO|nr:unnamed protein product [Schistocephalus solidus]
MPMRESKVRLQSGQVGTESKSLVLVFVEMMCEVYCPPRRDPVTDAYLLEELEKIATRLDILILGDFNAPHMDWSLACAHSSDLALDGCLLSTTLKLLLTQHVTFPTRVCEGQQANGLDLVLTKSQDSIDEVSCLPPLGKSDHVPAGRDGCPGCGRWEEPNFEEPQVRVGYQLEAATGAFTTCTRQMERPNAICVVLPLTSTPTPQMIKQTLTDSYMTFTPSRPQHPSGQARASGLLTTIELLRRTNDFY